MTTSDTRSLFGNRSASAALVSPIRGRSSKTSTAQPGDPGRRVQLGGEDLQQRRLAGAVRPDHHPPVGLVDRPVDPVEQPRVTADDRHPGQLHHCSHAQNLRGRRRRAVVGW
jgi:hypothetical protein